MRWIKCWNGLIGILKQLSSKLQICLKPNEKIEKSQQTDMLERGEGGREREREREQMESRELKKLNNYVFQMAGWDQ